MWCGFRGSPKNQRRRELPDSLRRIEAQTILIRADKRFQKNGHILLVKGTEERYVYYYQTGEAALPGKKQYEKGFTLPELLVSLCILMILLQGVWQWGVLFQRTTERIQQNQQAVLIAQCYFANFPLDLPAGWSVNCTAGRNRNKTGAAICGGFLSGAAMAVLLYW